MSFVCLVFRIEMSAAVRTRTFTSDIITGMILVTGGTGFIGQTLVRQLVAMGSPVRTLLRPSTKSPALPIGVPVEVAVCSLLDERGLRAAMKGVDVVFHLASAERESTGADLTHVDVEGTQMVAQAAAQAGIERIFYLSHIGADRSSAYPVLRAKALAEAAITHSGVPFTIFRSGPVFGEGDSLFSGLARLMRTLPVVFLMPGDGRHLVQPIWVEDLVACLLLTLENETHENKTYSIGGMEYLSLRQVVKIVEQATGMRRIPVDVYPATVRTMALWYEQTFHRFPLSLFWLDYLAADRTCPVDTIPRMFGLMPARLGPQSAYLKSVNYTKNKRIKQ